MQARAKSGSWLKRGVGEDAVVARDVGRGPWDVGAMRMQPWDWEEWVEWGTGMDLDTDGRRGQQYNFREACACLYGVRSTYSHSWTLRLRENRARKLGERAAGGAGGARHAARNLDTAAAPAFLRVLWSSRTREYLGGRPSVHCLVQHTKRAMYPCQSTRYHTIPEHRSQAGCPVRQYQRIHVPVCPAVSRMYLFTSFHHGLSE